MFQVYGMPGVARPQLPVSLGTRLIISCFGRSSGSRFCWFAGVFGSSLDLLDLSGGGRGFPGLP